MPGPYGLTAQGFNLPRIPDLRTELETGIQAAIPGSNVAVQSVWGQVIGVFAAALAEVYEATYATYTSLDVLTAEGVSLDRLGLVSGIARNTGETDADYRNRLQAPALLASRPQNSTSALCNSLQALQGVELVTVTADVANCSYSVIILGGDDEQIAQTIFAYHPTGMNITGTSAFLVESGCGFCQTIRFTRPTPIDVSIRLTIDLLPGPCNCDTSSTASFEDAVYQHLTGGTAGKCAPSLGAVFHAASFYQPLMSVTPVNIVQAEYSLDNGINWRVMPLTLGPADYPVWSRQKINVRFA